MGRSGYVALRDSGLTPGRPDGSDNGLLAGLRPVGGHGCKCAASRAAAISALEWRPSACQLPPWSAAGLCSALGGRRLTLMGDSTMQQVAGALFNEVAAGGGGCESALYFVQSDTLIGEDLGHLNRGPTWERGAALTGADVVLVNAGLHVSGEAEFRRVLTRVAEGLANASAFAQPPLLVWATSLGTPPGGALLPRAPADTPGFWDAQRRARPAAGNGGVFNHDQLEGWDAIAREFWVRVPGASVLDLAPFWLRGDAKVQPDGSADVVHNCVPGFFREYGRMLAALLRARPGAAAGGNALAADALLGEHWLLKSRPHQ